eukprot:Opistho-2@96644
MRWIRCAVTATYAVVLGITIYLLLHLSLQTDAFGWLEPLTLTRLDGLKLGNPLYVDPRGNSRRHKFEQSPSKRVTADGDEPQRRRASSHCAYGNLSFLVIGDWGQGDANQRAVARTLASHARSRKASFAVSTGDNIYPFGVSESTRDEALARVFADVYGEHEALRGMDWYATLGNHDCMGDPLAQLERPTQSDSGPNKEQLHPRWKMPSRYYAFSSPSGSAWEVRANVGLRERDHAVPRGDIDAVSEGRPRGFSSDGTSEWTEFFDDAIVDSRARTSGTSSPPIAAFVALDCCELVCGLESGA